MKKDKYQKWIPTPPLFEITIIILVIFVPIFLYLEKTRGCLSSNPKLADEIIKFAKLQGSCVCDGGSCEYWCERYRELKHFNDSCKIGGVCIGSWC